MIQMWEVVDQTDKLKITMRIHSVRVLLRMCGKHEAFLLRLNKDVFNPVGLTQVTNTKLSPLGKTLINNLA